MKVIITPEAKQRLDLYVAAVDGEISGLGSVMVLKGNMYIADIFLLRQESSSSETELNAGAVSELLNELIAAGEPVEMLKLHWHSHANMSAFWSGQDDKTAEGFANGWMLSLVINKKGEYKCRLDVYEPVHLLMDNITMEVGLPAADVALVAEVAAEVKEKVKVKTYSAVTFYNGNKWAGVGYGNGIKSDDKAPWDPKGNWVQGPDNVWRHKVLSAEEIKKMQDEEEREWAQAGYY